MKLRSERKGGVLLAVDPEVASGKSPTLGPLGLTKNQSSRWQSLASIPEPDFDAYIAEAYNDGREGTAAAIARTTTRQKVGKCYRPY